MATLTAWKFSTIHGADSAEYTLRDLERRGMIVIHDAAIVSWDPQARRPTTRQLEHPKTWGAARGSFWGLLFGLIFAVPIIGVAVGATVGAVRRSLRDAGIDDGFIEDVRREVVPGTSAIFLLTSDAVIDEVVKELAELRPELISTSLSVDQEQALRQRFGDEGDSESSGGEDTP